MNSTASLWQRVVRATTTLPMTQTLVYYAAFVALGLTTASLGPTLLGLSRQTASELSQISFLFTARALGYMVGSFVGGRLYDRLPGHRTMGLGLFAIAALLALVPTIPLLWLLTLALLLIGTMEGVVDVGGNTLIVWVHRQRVGPYMNGLHLFYAVGAFLSPVLIVQAVRVTGGIAGGYWLLALLLVPIAIRLLPLRNPAPIVTRENAADARPNLLLLALFVLFFGLFAGAEQSFGGWVFTYSVKSGLTDELTAGYVNAVFWGAFMLGRAASIPIAARVRPRIIVITALALALTGLGVLLLASASPTALWVGTVLVGLGLAAPFPTMLTFAERHMVITGQMTGWFFVGASAGGMILPWVIGQLFALVGPQAVLLVVSAALALALGTFGVVLVYLRRHEG